MIETALFYLHSALLLIFGVLLSASFAGVSFSRRNLLRMLGLCIVCGGLQLILMLTLSESSVRALYPLITHLPVVLLLVSFRKRIGTAVLSVLVAYLLCQPANWMGLLVHALTQNAIVEYTVRIVCLVAVGLFSVYCAAPCLGEIFNKDARVIGIFAIVPSVYYLFDYMAAEYTDIWEQNYPVAIQFLPMVLCISFVVFCMIYYRQYEQKADAQRKEQIVRTVVQQQAVQIERVQKVEQELRMVRHDMRHLLERVALSLDANDIDKAREMLGEFITHIDATRLTRYCEFETINYILSAFASTCEKAGIRFEYNILLEEPPEDEMMFCSILQNALDNALHAQQALAKSRRQIHLLLKTVDNKLLLSVKNPIDQPPVFVDGLPVAKEPGHGYGTQSIRYLSERLGGSCQFSVRGGDFLLQVVI